MLPATPQGDWRRRIWNAVRIPAWSALVLLALGLGLAAWAGVEFRRDTMAIDRHTTFIIRLERVLSALKDVETGQRGYLLTGDERYLAPYRNATSELDGLIASARALHFATEPLFDLVAKRRAASAQAVLLFQQTNQVAAVSSAMKGVGMTLMEQIRTDIAREEADADQEIGQRRHRQRHVALPLAVAASILTLLAFAVMGWVAIRRRRAQQASLALLEGVLDNAPVGLGFLDSNLDVRQLNKALLAMSEQSLSTEVGTPIWAALPQMQSALERRLKDVVATGRPVSNLEVTAAGTRHTVSDRHFQVSLYPLTQAGRRTQGRIEGVGMVVADVTARRRSEQRTRESEERFRILTQAVSTLIWVTDGEGVFSKGGEQWSRFTGDGLGTSKRSWLGSVHPEDRAAVEAAWDTAVSTRSPFKGEHRLRRHDGVWRHMAVTAAPVTNEDGSLREWVGSHADITVRKEEERELEAALDAAEAANRAKSVFLANMSHELRTPLSAVIGYSEVMEDQIEDLGDKTLVADLGKIKSNARHLLSLINDVLDLSKIEANRMEAYAEDVAIVTLANDVAGTVEALFTRRKNRLGLDISDDVGTMHTDVVKLRQCLINLLSNAAKFTENGDVVLAASREYAADGDWIVFRVEDTGIGMTADQVERLFERFTQADETTTRKFGGTGLGLAITRAFCSLMGGTVSVESDVGRGTTFTMRLPALMPEGAVSDETAPSPTPSEVSSKGDVLVIDDDPAQRELMCRFIERQGFVPHATADGPAGLAAAKALKPRAILLDVMMPRMDGWAVLTALKKDPDLASIPVVMVTFVQDTGVGASLGASDYLTKPIHWDKLKLVLDRFDTSNGEILVVDDDDDARQRLVGVLHRTGWRTVEARNGLDALATVARAVPRVILLDLTMPVMDGFSFLLALRAKPECADVPVIVLTARDISATDRRRLSSATRVFQKAETSLSQIASELRSLPVPGERRAS